jgi:hypothetical protein
VCGHSELKGDGKAIDSPAINHAIDAVAFSQVLTFFCIEHQRWF